MRASRLFLHTLRDDPAETEIVSHRLMVRAGLIKQLAAGIFSWLPLGWRVARKIEQIVREEMDAAGAAEVMMPAIQPAELWRESRRWDHFGTELLRLKDRHDREFCIGPTHEEVVTDIARGSIASWRHLPFNLYQIQTKFRDEIRPRHGVMRAREFIMKDAYSFDRNEDGALHSYQAMRDAYVRIFDRIGLEYMVVAADSGAIGGNKSEEFLVLAENGEGTIASTDAGYAANLDQVPCPQKEDTQRPEPGAEMQRIETPGIDTIEKLQQFLPERLAMARCVKTMIVEGEKGMAAILLAGDATLNIAKVGTLPEVGGAARLADPKQAREEIGAGFGSLGPVNMPLPVIADFDLASTSDFACGANKDGEHFVNVNFGRDCPEPRLADVRLVTEGEPAPDGRPLSLSRGIEVGHIFYLGTKYSIAMGATFEDKSGNSLPMEMGCYGIGVTRIVAAAIEQNHDERGIVFPSPIAPFSVAVLPLGKEEEVWTEANAIYERLSESGLDVLLDDRGLRAGAAFADIDLIGIPHRIVVSARGLSTGMIEHKHRGDDKPSMIPREKASELVADMVDGNMLAS